MATNQRQYRVATTRSQRPPSRPLARRTERQLVNDDKAEDPSGGDSDDHYRRHPQINSNSAPTSVENTSTSLPSAARQVALSCLIPFPTLTTQLRHTFPRQCGLSVSSDAKSDEHMQRHSRGWSSSSRSSFVASSTSSLSSVQASAESSASSSPSCHHTRHARRCSHRHLRRHYWYHHYHRCYGYSHRESHSPTPFVSCAPPPHNRIISKIR